MTNRQRFVVFCILALIAFLSWTDIVHSQIAVPPEDAGGDAGAASVTIERVTPGFDVPMGTKVKLEASTTSPSPSWWWSAACNGVNPWRHGVDWTVL